MKDANDEKIVCTMNLTAVKTAGICATQVSEAAARCGSSTAVAMMALDTLEYERRPEAVRILVSNAMAAITHAEFQVFAMLQACGLLRDVHKARKSGNMFDPLANTRARERALRRMRRRSRRERKNK